MSFDGNLIYLGGTVPFPREYILGSTYKTGPNRRQDLDSHQNANGELIRTVVSHRRSTVSFQIDSKTGLTNTDLQIVQTLLRNAFISEDERKLTLKFYADDVGDYQTGVFYMPNPEYQINRIDYENKVIYYDPVTLEFIEY